MHGIIINLTSGIPFVFQFNPESIETKKNINYFIAPNIGGSSQEVFFSGFQNREIELRLEMIDKRGINEVSLYGVRNKTSFFESLGEPDPGILGIAASFDGNENYPPPKILYQFGMSFSPLVYEVSTSPVIRYSEFQSGSVAGIVGIPTRATVDLSLRLDEQNILNKAEQIARKVRVLAGSSESLVAETMSKLKGTRKEAPFA